MRERLCLFLVIGAMLAVHPRLAGEEPPLASRNLTRALRQEVSGERAFRDTVLISHYDRIQAGEGWHAAAEMIRGELERIGYRDARIEGWPSNGSRFYYTYRTPIGWRARSAELWQISPRRERLCSYEEIPLTLVKHSNAGRVESELIDVGTGLGEKAYAGKDVRGKIVLATAYTGDVMREAVVKRGALGVVTWYPPEVRPGFPNMIRYTAVWPTWEEREKIGLGFNVSKQQGWRLKKMLEEGQKVVLRAEVDAEYYDGRIETLTAALPGTEEPEREILIIGHLCHPSPSANDNASGSGGMLEMARALRTMLDRGLIPPLRRTIRFLWVPEFYGTVPYIKAHLERTRNTLAVINCDMIGEDLHLTGGTFNLTCTPDSVPSYLNDLVVNFIRLAASLDLTSMNGSRHPFAYRILPYSGGSDHVVFNDGALKVPAVMFGHGDTFHHTSLDTPDKVDASELRRVCFIALGATVYLAGAGDQEALSLARLVARNAVGRLAADYYDSLETMSRADSGENLHAAYRRLRSVIRHTLIRESAAVRSTAVLTNRPATARDIEAGTGNLTALEKTLSRDAEDRYRARCRELDAVPRPLSLTEEEEILNHLIPERAEDFVCPLQTDYLIEKLGENALRDLRLQGLRAYEALNFVDGRRSVTEIAHAVSAELGPTSVREVHAFFELLERADLLTLRSR